MYLGTQIPAHSDDDFRIMAQLGVIHICADPVGNPHDWTVDILVQHRERIESFGLKLDMVQLPLSSRAIEENKSPAPEFDICFSS
jgi:mannonate dehydratase